MKEFCLISYEAKKEIRRKHPKESACDYCVYGRYGCTGTEESTFEMKVNSFTERFVIAEKSPEDLPKNGIWCKHCQENCGRIFHETLWCGKFAYAVKCPRCENTWILYKSRVLQGYTGFTRYNGTDHA